MSDVAARLEVSRPTATVALEKLEQKGYVTKVPSSIDRRVSHVHLTVRTPT